MALLKFSALTYCLTQYVKETKCSWKLIVRYIVNDSNWYIYFFVLWYLSLFLVSSLNHFCSMFLFNDHWKHQKTFSFLCFQGLLNSSIGQKWVNQTRLIFYVIFVSAKRYEKQFLCPLFFNDSKLRGKSIHLINKSGWDMFL